MVSVTPSRAELLEDSAPHGHIVQLYQADERVLIGNVSNYLWEGLKQGDGLLVIATKEHSGAFDRQLTELGVDTWDAMRERRLVYLDAEQTLSRFMVEGEPNWILFEGVVRAAMQTITGHAGLRAYGEMVGILWQKEQYSAAIRLEELWNDLLKLGGFKLFCAYPIDVFGSEFHSEHVEALLCAHTHLVSAGENGAVGTALNRAMDQVLGPTFDARSILDRHKLPAWAMLPEAEAAILSLRINLPDHADDVLVRARQHYHSEKRFRALVENSSDAICLLDSHGKVLYASASTRRVLGKDPEELIGREAFDLIHPDDADRAAGVLQHVLAKPRCPVTLEARMPQHDGSWRWVESTISNLLDEPNVSALVLNCRDISERKAADEEKQRVREDLARSNAELQAFAYAATHDLQEPLRTVCAFTELLVKTTPMDGNARQFATFVVDGVKRMSSLLDDLLSFTRLNVDDLKSRVELSDAVEQSISNLAGAIHEAGATITVDRLPAIRGNASHLVELFQNLIANAIKYRSERPVEIHITAEQLGHDCIVKVKDNGIGIAPEYQDYVFGLFKRLHNRDIPGTGIGLAICKKILDGMGGRIWVESELGQGSTFCFSAAAAEPLVDGFENIGVSLTAGAVDPPNPERAPLRQGVMATSSVTDACTTTKPVSMGVLGAAPASPWNTGVETFVPSFA